jgi:4a-hydroxytetrahydrobiopterin dehydratase
MDVIWKESGNKMTCSLLFPDFGAAISFMVSVAIVAEKQNHHPEWSNVYNRVSIQLSTHDAGNMVTEKDHMLAKEITRILSGLEAKNL